MAEHSEQVWVTSAVLDKDVGPAMTLCYSLRRTFTTRKVAVIASSKLSLNLRQALHQGFDLVFYLDEELNSANLKLEDFAKLYSFLSLQIFDKCAFVSPNMLALKNCDDIFSVETDAVVMGDIDKASNVTFLFKPTAENFHYIIAGLDNIGKDGSPIFCTLYDLNKEFNFNIWLQSHFNKEVTTLDGKYNKLIEKGKPLVGNTGDIWMVNLENFPNISMMNELKEDGILEQLIANDWFKIINQDVLPLIIPNSNHALRTNPLEAFQRHREPIAIVGMSCRYPGFNSMEDFWNLLSRGTEGTGNPPPFRWSRDNDNDCSTNANVGSLKIPVDEFDATFSEISKGNLHQKLSPNEAIFMDPQHRLMDEVVWEALEDACIDPTTLRGTSSSIVMGSEINEYDKLNSAGIQDYYRKYMGNSIGAATARLSFLLGLIGPSTATESACSSAMMATHLACRSLRNGETNFAIAGGVNLLTPFENDILPAVVSPDGQSKAFSVDANAFARAEGCGVVVLKRFSDAVRDGDNIWALVRGTAIAREGLSASIETPTTRCESLAMKMALKDAGIRAEKVSYVEGCGTGTVVGDPLEIAAIANAYHSPCRPKPLIIGSVKTNVGETESCSGITGIMKVVLCMKYEAIPAHRNFAKFNPAINLEAVPAVLPMERLDWKKNAEGIPRMAGVSLLDITGTSAHMILEETPDTSLNSILTLNTQFDRPLHLLKLSAKTKGALMTLFDNYKHHFETSQDSVADVAYSVNIGRADFTHRAVIVANSKENVINCIDKQKYLIDEIDPSAAIDKICFLFNGQGSQYPGMAKMLYSCSPVFQMHFDNCQKLFKDCYNINIKNGLWLEQKEYNYESQTSIFCVEYSLLKLWESWGVKPDFVLGHSLGEFVAAVCAGFMSLEDAIQLYAEGCNQIDQLPGGKMLVVQANTELILAKLKEFAGSDESKYLDIAAINSSSQVVVAGDEDVVIAFSTFCTERNIKNVMLLSTHACHSKHMNPMLDDYRNVASKMKMGKTGKCKYISGLRGDCVSPENITAEYWVEHIREKVNFLEASKTAVKLGCRIFIEIGPQPVLSVLTMMNTETNITCLPSLQKNKDDWETILTSLGRLYLKGVGINWSGLDQFYKRQKIHSLPHYPFKMEKFGPAFIKHDDGNLIHSRIGSLFPNKPDMDEHLWNHTCGNKVNTLSNINSQSADFWKRYDSLETMSEKIELLGEKLKSYLLRNILKLEDTDVIQDNTTFQEMGVDSLMFMEISNSVQGLLGNRVFVNASVLKDSSTTGMLSDTIFKIIEGETMEEDTPPTQQQVIDLIKEDSYLPENICGKSGQEKIIIQDVSKVLLTGCTGVLGPYILKELVNISQIREVICVMRSQKRFSETDRLKNILLDRELIDQMDMSKVRCVTGNVAKPNLGMEAEIWEELCENVDAIFHCAAIVQHVEYYKKRPKDDDVRAVNVGGLKNILTFACTGSKLKRVFYASSIFAVVTLDKDGCASEDWPSPTDFDGVTNLAYPISKFVGDLLMKTAVLERGIPGTVFRFPVIMGDSKSGRFVLEQNHVMLRFLFMLKYGIMPSIPYPYPTLPVDICASASVKLFFNPNTPNDIFNVSNVTPDREQEFVHVAKKLGYEVDIVEYSEFCQRIYESTSEDSPMVLFREFYKCVEDIMSFYTKSAVLQRYILDGYSNQNFLVSKKIAKIMPEFYNERDSSMDQIYRDLLFAQKQGWFDKYNI